MRLVWATARHANHNAELPAVRSDSGFTLIELILATAISALVISILSVCLSFALRAWESTQNRKPDQSTALVELLKRQLSEFDPTPIRFEEGLRPFFAGDPRSLAFATSHSVKAISKGVPVAVRYVYDPKSKVLFYAEIPLDPYHPKAIREFLQISPPGDKKSGIRFYAVELANFSLAYSAKGISHFSETWERDDEAPITVLVKWDTADARLFAQLLMINSPFTIQSDKGKVTSGPARVR